MKEISLTKEQVTQVDDWNYDWLNQWKWRASNTLYGSYAIRWSTKEEHKNNKRYVIYMHCFILGITNHYKTKGEHKDRDRLNNQEFNLRPATQSQNIINTIRKNNTGYRGVCYHTRDKSFQASIQINGKHKHLGYFDDPIEAAKLYDEYARKYHGEFAITNFNKQIELETDINS